MEGNFDPRELAHIVPEINHLWVSVGLENVLADNPMNVRTPPAKKKVKRPGKRLTTYSTRMSCTTSSNHPKIQCVHLPDEGLGILGGANGSCALARFYV